VSVISVSIPKNELKKFDEVIEDLGFSSRSDAIREALHRFIVQHRWTEDIDETQPFITTIIYPSNKEEAVHSTLHGFDKLIITATHTHFAERCVEWVILKGSKEDIDRFIKSISAIKDVMACKCSI
jgi:CopG family nickel-responsive transcriptional regulator